MAATARVRGPAGCGPLACSVMIQLTGAHPIVLLFVAALVVNLWSRMTSWLGRGAGIAPRRLNETIAVVAVASPGETVESYIRLLYSAKWPARITIRMLKMLGPQEVVDESAWRAHHASVRITKRFGSFDRAGERARLLREGSLGSSEYILLLGQPMEPRAFASSKKKFASLPSSCFLAFARATRASEVNASAHTQ